MTTCVASADRIDIAMRTAQKKPLIAEWVVFCILMVSFSVYYLGVYMFLGLMNLFIFSVSTTLKSYVLIIARWF